MPQSLMTSESSLGPTKWNERTDSCTLSSDFHRTCSVACACSHTYLYANEIKCHLKMELYLSVLFQIGNWNGEVAQSWSMLALGCCFFTVDVYVVCVYASLYNRHIFHFILQRFCVVGSWSLLNGEKWVQTDLWRELWDKSFSTSLVFFAGISLLVSLELPTQVILNWRFGTWGSHLYISKPYYTYFQLLPLLWHMWLTFQCRVPLPSPLERDTNNQANDCRLLGEIANSLFPKIWNCSRTLKTRPE